MTPRQADPIPDAGSHSLSGQPTVRNADSERKRELLAQGRKLRQDILTQHQRCYVAPFNKEESWRLKDMQERFARWEREAVAVGIDVQAEFTQLPLLRPYPARTGLTEPKRMLSVPEVHMISKEQPVKKAQVDRDIWSGLPPGI